MRDNISELLKLIPNIGTGTRFILGIDGLSRSGKTTLVNELSQNLKEKNIPFHIFHIDDHIVEREKRYGTGHEEWFEYYNLQWNIEWLRDHFFEKLRFSNLLSLPFYANESDTQSIQNIELADTCLIVIEGIFLQRKEWRSFFDYVVYLDCLRDKRFLRETEVTQRSIAKFENRYWKAEEFYFKTEIPKENANLVLKG